MSRSFLAAAFLSALVALTFFSAPEAFAAVVHLSHGADPHAVFSHMSMATLTLAALRSKEGDLVARAAAKLGEISDSLAPDAIRAIETEHGRILGEVEAVRGHIVEAERAAAVDPVAIRTLERERIAGIRSVARKLGLADEVSDKAVNDGTGLDAFRTLAIDAAAERQQPIHSQNPGASDRGQQHRTYAQPKGEKVKGTDATRAMIALAACRGSRRDAADYVSQHYGPEGDVVARALSTSIGSAGGFLVPVDMASEVIELLRPASTVMALDPVIIPMPHGNMSIPRIQGGANAGYVGENQPTNASQQSFGMVQLSAKKLTSVVPISNDMIRFPSAATDAIVRNDMVLSIATRADLAFVRGQGSSFSPRGLKSFAASPSLAGANLIVAGVLVGSAYGAQSQANAIQALATVTNDLSRAELALENANIKMTKPGWIFSPRTKQYLMNIRDGLGNQIYYAEMSKGMLRGKPFKTTTQIPNNLIAVATDGTTPTADGSEIYLADFAEVYIGEAHGLELDVFPGGAYVDASGNLVSGVSNDQTVMRAIVQHDMNMRQEAAVALITGVRWF
ncbi:phage major capsid protein [Beijerinckia sp. L45]|uniref:phage major capsid protein n=1 Tax=Beijerinckia sp. L45 TaxID=1641855 RepID=UPI00131B246A|nr:phage major capsid protein [Beijerinckia sp. L45]